MTLSIITKQSPKRRMHDWSPIKLTPSCVI
jgi:hypothetical protein